MFSKHREKDVKSRPHIHCMNRTGSTVAALIRDKVVTVQTLSEALTISDGPYEQAKGNAQATFPLFL